MARILVVDDDEPTRRLLDLILLESGDHDVGHAASALEAVAAVEAGVPDLLILDMRLPDMDGVTLFQRMREAGYLGPVLALTASSARDPLLEELRAEPDAPSILLKPFDVDELAERVETLLRGKAATAGAG